jgi:aspartate 1-decarboxylase
MLREMLQSKLHHATVTDCRLGYAGSLTIDMDLVDRAGMLPYQKIQLLNSCNGPRLETYIIPGTRGSGEIIVNGAAARLAQPGDTVIVIAYVMLTPEEIEAHKPTVLVLGEGNKVLEQL